MWNHQINKKKNDTKSKRLENRFLYVLSFKIPLTSSYSNRALVNYINIILARDLLIQKNRNTSYFSLLNSIYKGTLDNLVINNILKFYI
jgi:hypothetical protein